jgi:hypothetical protein
MRKLLTLLLAAVLLPALAAGCGSEKDKGVNSLKDKPKADKNG